MLFLLGLLLLIAAGFSFVYVHWILAAILALILMAAGADRKPTVIYVEKKENAPKA